jgi:hypothetical protein
MIRIATSADDAVAIGVTIKDLSTVKVKILWVDRLMCRKDLEFEGIGWLQLPADVLERPHTSTVIDAQLKFSTNDNTKIPDSI